MLTPGNKRTALEAAQMHAEKIRDKLFVITGPYSEIGVETTKAFLDEGGKVVLGGRNAKLLELFCKEMKQHHILDLADLASVQAFAHYVSSKYETVDMLIANAGVMNTPAGVTKNGIEMQMGVNCVGHVLLAKLLASKTKRQYDSPRINIDFYKNFSEDNTNGYNGWKACQQSKPGNILLAKEFDKRCSHLEAASVHPGDIVTNLARYSGCCDLTIFLLGVFPTLWKRVPLNSRHPKQERRQPSPWPACRLLWPESSLLPEGITMFVTWA